MFLQSLPWDKYQILWQSEGTTIEARPIAGLGSCKQPDTRTFKPNLRGQGRKGTVGHFRSMTGASRLIVPVLPHAHLACFVRDASPKEFADLITTIHDLVRRAPPGARLRVFTHGLEVNWLHVKIQPDPLMR
jgi:hypothetical protein